MKGASKVWDIVQDSLVTVRVEKRVSGLLTGVVGVQEVVPGFFSFDHHLSGMSTHSFVRYSRVFLSTLLNIVLCVSWRTARPMRRLVQNQLVPTPGLSNDFRQHIAQCYCDVEERPQYMNTPNWLLSIKCWQTTHDNFWYFYDHRDGAGP